MDEEAYEDEPMTSVRPEEFSGNQLVIENMDEVERKRQKRRRKRQKRLERLGKIAVCVCCVGVILAIVLTIVLTEAAIAVTTPPPPTPAPTPMPAVPTYKPTVAHPTAKVPAALKPVAAPTLAPVTPPTTPVPTLGVQDTYTLKPIQDTYIYTNGVDMSKAYGKEEMMLVQSGYRTNDDIADSVALLIFDTAKIPSFDQLAEEDKKAILKLYHKPLSIENRDREPAPMTVARFSTTDLSIESVNGGTFEVKNFWDGQTVKVPTNATEVSFDITDLYFNDAFAQDQVFLMLQTRNQEQNVGDQFYSRESDTPPELTLTGMAP